MNRKLWKILLLLLLFTEAVWAQTSIVVTGKITDTKGEVLPGANVVMKGNTSVACVSDMDGHYAITIPDAKDAILVYSFVGMTSQEVKIGKSKVINVALKEDAVQLNNVEVIGNGMFMRRSETFTGAATTYSGDQLRLNGSMNAIQSLKNLDPSFIINESAELGSDPNTCLTYRSVAKAA